MVGRARVSAVRPDRGPPNAHRQGAGGVGAHRCLGRRRLLRATVLEREGPGTPGHGRPLPVHRDAGRARRRARVHARAGRGAAGNEGLPATGRVSRGPGRGARPHRVLRGPPVAVGGSGRNGRHLHLRERHRPRRGQPRPGRRAGDGRGHRAARRVSRRPPTDRRGADHPFSVRPRGAGRRTRKELLVTSHEQKGFTVWFTGLSGAGKSTLAEMLHHELRKRELRVEILDGDVVRTNLSKGLGFSREDRDTNILRIGFVANLLTRNSVATIVSAGSPYRDARGECRSNIKEFVEVYVHATVEEGAKRDVKGLYAKALAGEITRLPRRAPPDRPPPDPRE